MPISSSVKATLTLFVFATLLPAAATLTSLSVTESYPPCAPFDITITGSNFDNSAEAYMAGSSLSTTFVSGTEVTATVTSADLASPGATSLVVSQAEQADSNALPFTISTTPFTSMSPDAAETGDGDTLLTVTGDCYESGAEILWDGSPLTTTFVNSTTLTATIPAANFASAGTATVTVRNANGNVSNSDFFDVDDPDPVVSSLSPSSSYPPCAPFTLTVTGEHFTNAFFVVFDSGYLTTTFVNSTTLTATVTSGDLSTPGSVSVYVDQPKVATSNSVPFTVGATPIDSLTPNSATAGAPDTLLTVTGSCYESGAEILWNGSPLTTTFVNSTTLTATIPAANLASVGDALVSVRNTNGNTSSTLVFAVEEPLPTLSSIAPTSSYPPCGPFNITVTGTNFNDQDEVVLGGSYLGTTFVNSTTLTATVTSADLASPGSVSLFVDRPEVTQTGSLPFQINATPLDSMAPSSATAGDGATLLTVTGSCFESGAEILWDGSPLTTTFVNSTTLTATIPAPDLASAGSASVTVRNANGNTSAGLSFTIDEQPPVISMISPTLSYPPCAPFSITVTGQNFTASGEVYMAGSPLATTFVNAMQLTATVTSADLASQGSKSVFVREPAHPDSNSVSFLVRATPLDSISPDTAAAGSGDTLLTVTGSCYESGAEILWNGAPLTTTFVNSTMLTATIPASNLASVGSATVTVRNANGNTSAGLTFTIGDPPPSLTSLSPTASYPPCAPFDITITGQHFTAAAEAYLGGSALATSFVSSTELTATVTSALLATAGSAPVIVRVPAQPDSNSLPFEIRATPLDSMLPTSTPAGSAATLLTVTGSCYEAGAEILWNGSPLATTFVSATTLTATIPAGDLAAEGSATVSVRNANGNVSATLPFTIGAAQPVLSSITPTASYPPCAPFDITLTGQNFTDTTTAFLAGVALSTGFVSSTQLTATVTTAMLAQPGAAAVFVREPMQPDSNSRSFQISATPLDSMLPTSAPAGSAATLLTVTGSCYEAGAEILWNGSPLATTFVSSTTLTATIPAGDLASAGSATVSVLNANGNPSAALVFSIGIPAAVITSISPTEAPAGSPTVTVGISGSGFESTAQVLLDGAPLAASAVSWLNAGLIQISVPASAMASPGSLSIEVQNSNAPKSNAVGLTVVAQSNTPVIERVRPSTGPPPCAPFEITVEGQNLPFDGQVVMAGVPLVTRPGNGAQLIATVTSAALAQSGTVEVVVRPSNGSDSAPFPFLVAPTPITGVLPSSSAVGGPALPIEVKGSCFEPGATILWNGTPLPTTLQDSGTLDAVVPAANFSTAGTALVSVRNPNGNTSVTFPFRIGPPPGGAPAPVITSLAPAEALAGPLPLTVHINGKNFDSLAAVVLDDVPVPKSSVTWLDATHLIVTLPGSAVSEARVIAIEVENPDGSKSGPMLFKVLPTITGITPQTWTVGRPCELFIAGRGFTDRAAVLIEGVGGSQRLTPTTASEPTQMTVCVPPELVSTPGKIEVSVCILSGPAELCSAPITIEVTSGLSITQLRPMSAQAGDASLCMAVDVEAPGGDPGALTARWDGANLPAGIGPCPASATLYPEVRQIAQGIFATTVLAQIDASRLARERSRNPAIACAADPVAPKITVFAASLPGESAPACFDITSLMPVIPPPGLEIREDGCVSVVFTGENIHRMAEVSVEGLEGGFCDGGEPMVSGCGLNGADSSVCTQVGFSVPSGSGFLSVSIRNPVAVCQSCSAEIFTVDIDQAEAELPPDELSLLCPGDLTSFARTAVGSQSRLSCEIGNSSDATGRIGALSIAAPFTVDASACTDVLLQPGESCAVDLTFAPASPGLFSDNLTADDASGASAAIGRYIGVGTLRSAALSIVGGPSLPPTSQSAVRVETDGADGSTVLVRLRQSLRLDPALTAFPTGEGVPQIDCGFPAAAVGVEYAQPLVAACDTAGSSWEIVSTDGGSWASVDDNTVTGTPTEAGVFSYEIRLNPGFAGAPAVTQTCSITVLDGSSGGGTGGAATLLPCTNARFEMGGASHTEQLDGDNPIEVPFQAGTVSGSMRFVAGFEADGVDVGPEGPSPRASANVTLSAPVVTSATFSCPSSSQLVVEVTGYSSTREISALQFAFQAAPGATTSLQLAADAAARPDLVTAFQTRFSSSSNDLDGDFTLRAIFAVSGRAADIGGVNLTLQNSVGSASTTAGSGQPACSAAQ